MVKLRLVALGTIVAILGLLLALSALKRQRIQPVVDAAIAASAAASAAAAASAVAMEPVANAEPAALAPNPQSLLLSPVSSNGVRDYAVLPDGRPVPELPATAPKSCGFGVILVTFEGVQLAPRHARTKLEALELAKRLVPEAEKDFAEAVKKGDPGSLADAGSISRGVLERSVEYQLFTLEKGKIYPEPVETPRGFWILRRLR